MEDSNKRFVSLRHIGINSIWTFFSRVTGIIKQMIFTYLFGYGGDTFWAAFRFVNAFRRYIGEGGALGSAFIPVFSQLKIKEGDEASKSFAYRIMTVFGIFSIVLVVFLSLTAFFYGPLLAPGFGRLQMMEYIFLMMIMMPYLFFISWYALQMGVLNSFKIFGSSAAGPVVFNLVFIVLPLFFAGKLGIYVSAISVVIGVIAMVLLQWKDMKKIGYSFKLVLKPHPAEKKFWSLFWPTAGNMVALTIKNFFTTLFLSFFIGGYVVYMNAFTVVSAPLGIIAIAVGTVLMPVLSQLAQLEKKDSFNQAMQEGLSFLFFWTVPITFFLFFFPDLVNRLLFVDVFIAIFGRSGGMTSDLLNVSNKVLKIFGLSLLPMSLSVVFEKIFYSLHDARTPLKASLLTIFTTGGLYFLAFVPSVGLMGVIWAETISSYFVVLYYLVKLYKNGIGKGVWNKVLKKAAFYFLFSLLTSFLLYKLYTFFLGNVKAGFLYIVFSFGIFLLFVFFYYFLTRIFKVGIKV